MNSVKHASGKIKNDAPFISAAEAIAAFARGEMLILIDEEDRENEGDLVISAAHADAAAINFMAREGRGLICVTLTEERARQLNLTPMVSENTALLGTAFTISVDARRGTTTGISAADRSATVRALIDPATRPEDLARPGHVFPLVAVSGGVISRPGHTEAVVDLAAAAGLFPAGVLCEIMDDDGSMARLPRLVKLAKEHGLKLASVQDLVDYRCRNEQLIERLADVELPTDYGRFRLLLYQNRFNKSEHHLALIKGNPADGNPPLVRVHSECLTGDTFASLRCDCGNQLHHALQAIEQEGRGVLIYLRQEGRGIGLANKILAYSLQEEGQDTVQANETLGFKADLRQYWFAAQILREMQISRVRLMTNNPAKVEGLQRCGIEINERKSIVMHGNPINQKYLETKARKLGHLLSRNGG